MSRFTREQLNAIKKKLGVNELWSFSKVSTYDTCSWLYKMKYIDKVKAEFRDSAYTVYGSLSHEIIQNLWEKEHKYEDMIDIFNKFVLDWETKDDEKLRFPSDNVKDSYINNLRHYFSNTETIDYDVVNEKPVITELQGNNKYVFQGYLDSEFINSDEKLVILDYKTSSLSGFTGAKLIEKSRQLMVYALGVIQHGRVVNGKKYEFTADNIVLRYDMMKYLIVAYPLANGSIRETKAERSKWVAHISNQLRKDFDSVEKEIAKLEKKVKSLDKKRNAKVRTEDEKIELTKQIDEIESEIKYMKENSFFDVIELNEMIDVAISNNNLDNMPKFIQDKYKLKNCYIDVELNDEILDGFKADLIKTLDTVTELSCADNLDEAFDRERIEEGNSFYCNTLCDLKNECKFYKEYREHQSMYLNEENSNEDDILAMLGLG